MLLTDPLWGPATESLVYQFHGIKRPKNPLRHGSQGLQVSQGSQVRQTGSYSTATAHVLQVLHDPQYAFAFGAPTNISAERAIAANGILILFLLRVKVKVLFLLLSCSHSNTKIIIFS